MKSIIADLRERLGLTQAQMAVELNVGQAAVSQYETGNRIPKPDVMRRLTGLAKRAGVTYTLTDIYPDYCPAPSAPPTPSTEAAA